MKASILLWRTKAGNESVCNNQHGCLLMVPACAPPFGKRRRWQQTGWDGIGLFPTCWEYARKGATWKTKRRFQRPKMLLKRENADYSGEKQLACCQLGAEFTLLVEFSVSRMLILCALYTKFPFHRQLFFNKRIYVRRKWDICWEKLKYSLHQVKCMKNWIKPNIWVGKHISDQRKLSMNGSKSSLKYSWGLQSEGSLLIITSASVSMG